VAAIVPARLDRGPTSSADERRRAPSRTIEARLARAVPAGGFVDPRCLIALGGVAAASSTSCSSADRRAANRRLGGSCSVRLTTDRRSRTSFGYIHVDFAVRNVRFQPYLSPQELTGVARVATHPSRRTTGLRLLERSNGHRSRLLLRAAPGSLRDGLAALLLLL
jgi:hypothetical protein